MNKPLEIYNDNPTQDRFCVVRRIGIIAVYDTKHNEYEPDRPGCCSDFPWVIASWDGYTTTEGNYLYDWQISKAHYLCGMLNCYEMLRLIPDKPALM